MISDGASGYIVSFVAPLGMDGDGFSERQRYLQERLLSHGCVLNTYLANRDGQDPEKERQYLRSLFKVRPKGMIIVPTPIGGGNADILSQLARANLKIGHIDHCRDYLPAEPFVLPDWSFAGGQAVSVLASHGAKKIVLANPCGDCPSIRRIIEGIEAMGAMLGMNMSLCGVECSGRDRGTDLLRKAVNSLSKDSGIVTTHPDAAKMILEQSPAFANCGRIISIGEYDCGPHEIPSHPILAFSWMERVNAAMDYILASDEREAPRQLLKPRVLAWEHRKSLKKRY